MKQVIVAIAVIGIGLAAAPAMAQPTEAQQAEMLCVHAKLKADKKDEEIAEVSLISDAPKSVLQAAGALLDAAGKACQTQYGWSDKERGHGQNIGATEAVIQYLGVLLTHDGVTDETIGKVFEPIDGLTHEEQLALFTGRWADDAALTAKLRKVLVQRGVPDKDPVVATTIKLLEMNEVFFAEYDRLLASRFGKS